MFRQVALALVPPLNRLVRQRDELIRSTSKLLADSSDEHFLWKKHRPYAPQCLTPAVGAGSAADDGAMIERLLAAYRRASHDQYGQDSMWRRIFEDHHRDAHEAFMRGDIDAARRFLANPAANNLFYGFDELCLAFAETSREQSQEAASVCQDKLIRLAEAVGAFRLENPEYLQYRLHVDRPTDDILRAIESALGAEIAFPDIYPGAVGAQSCRGIVTYRAIHALYLAFRVQEVLRRGLPVGGTAPRICEIGAGLGRSALFAHQMGLTDYTLVDVPMTTISQGYYLMRCLGAEAVVLPGEARRAGAAITLLHGEDFFAAPDRFDLVANVDSLTEFGHATAMRYLRRIHEVAPAFLSINHEANEIQVGNLLRELGVRHHLSRYPYWLRAGHAEELVAFPPT